MQGQQSGSVSKLKRQLGFLKSIDQKLEGLRRENERLRRIVSNPRVRFSRSSLGGLYRIVNSMMSAGPMYDLIPIEQWAVKSRNWLIDLGKRGVGPSNDELDRLAETINELGEIRDTVLVSVEAALKEAPKMSNANESEDEATASDKEGSAETETDADADDAKLFRFEDTSEDDSNGNENENENDFPFTDEPEGRSIAEAEFWRDRTKKRSAGGKFRDRTSTIPLAIGDLTSVAPAPTSPKAPPPVPPSGAPGFWKPVAIVSLLGFLTMTALFLWTRQKLGDQEELKTTIAGLQASAQNVREASSSADSSTVKSPSNPAPMQAEAETALPTDSSPPEEKIEHPAPETPAKGAQAEKPSSPAPQKKPAKNQADSQPKSAAKTPTKKKSSVAKSTKNENEAEKNVGTLHIRAPDGGGSVLVLVDGISRGKAPIQVKLSPGLHEVVFTKDGKKSIRMVPIRPNATKTISAKIPE